MPDPVATVGSLVTFLKMVKDFIKNKQLSEVRNNDAKRRAIEQLEIAVITTKAEIKKLKALDKYEDDERITINKYLAILWKRVAHRFRRLGKVGERFAELCEVKSEYWSDPENWVPPESKRQINISLKSIERGLRDLNKTD